MDRTKLMIILTGVTLISGSAANAWLFQGRADQIAARDKVKKLVVSEASVSSDQVKMKTALDESSRALEHLEANVAQTAYIPTLVSELEQLGNSKGLKITGIKPKRINEKKPQQSTSTESSSSGDDKKAKKKKKDLPKPYDEWNLEVNAVGYYPAILDFIASLQNFTKIVEVYGVSIQTKMDSDSQYGPNGAPNLELTLTLKAYAFPDKNAHNDGDGSDSSGDSGNE